MTQVTPWSYPASQQTVAAYLAVLRSARDLGCTITRLKIAKILYLADLAAVEKGDDPVSGVEWRWLQHGPYNNDLMYLENQLVGSGAVRRRPYYYGWKLDLQTEPTLRYTLPQECVSLIHRLVGELGQLAANTLKDMSYQTAPMRDAQQRGRDVVLNLDLARPRPKLGRLANHMRRVLDRLEPQETDPGAPDELAAEISRLRPGRGRANATILGDE